MTKTKAKPARKPAPRRPKAKPTASRVHISLSPRAPWASHASRVALGWLAHVAHAPTVAAPADWWHIALAERDAETIAAQGAAIAENNRYVAATASGFDLGVRPIYETGILQFDAFDMAKRIEAASAKHAKKDTTRGRAKNQNRHLKFECPTCGLAARAAHADRVMLCLGRYDLPHAPAPMQFDVASQPDYRLADQSAAAGYSEPNELADNASGHHDRSAARMASEKAKTAATIAAHTEPTPTADGPTAEIPF